MAKVESRSRARVIAYTSALIIAIASAVFLVVVPFLPASPVVPILVGIGLGAMSLRNRGIAIASLYLLVYFSVLWQMIGFGFFQLLSAGVGVAVLLALALPLLPFMTRRVELSSIALAILAVALMLTPIYFVSIPLIAAAAFTFSGFASLEALAATFIFFLTPFLLLENALYYSTTSNPTVPILFSQFTLLSQNIRPPLPGLNVLLTGLPANYLSHYALPVTLWLSQSSGVLLVPTVIMGLVILASSSVGGLALRYAEKFEQRREITGRLKLVLTPLSVAVATPVVFIALIVLFSRPASGGYQTSLASDPSAAVLMLGSSLLLTTSFIGRETLILRLEGVQLGTEELNELMDSCIAKMRQVQELLDVVGRKVPSMNLSGERQSITEYSTYLSDVRRQLKGASGIMIAQFRSQLQATVLRPLTEEPELLRRNVASEIRGLIGATATANNHLKEANVPLMYPDISGFKDSGSLESLMDVYAVATAAIKDVTLQLSEAYVDASASLDVLMGQEEVKPPVNVSVLLQSNELIGAMRLVDEEYWLNFHLRWAEQLEAKKTALMQKMRGLDDAVAESERQRLKTIEQVVEAANPANSVVTLQGLRDLRSMLEEIINRAASAADRVSAMLETLELKSVKTLKFETMNRLTEVVELRKSFEPVGVSFDSLTKFLDHAAGVLRSQYSAWKSDRDNLVVLAQYPLAKKMIGSMLQGQKKLPLAKLPLQKKAAAMYAQLYATGNPHVEYNDAEECLVVKGEEHA